MDAETPGSRFTLKPAVAVYGRDLEPPAPGGEDALLESVFGSDALDGVAGLGDAEAVRTGVGRGGEGWAIALQWTAIVVLGGVIQGAAWDAVKTGAKHLIRLLQRARDGEKHALVSRGAAALIAIDALASELPTSTSIVIEAVEEPSSIAGVASREMNYVDIEPWLCFLVSLDEEVRYIVAVSPAGEVLGSARVRLLPFEADYARWSRG